MTLDILPIIDDIHTSPYTPQLQRNCYTKTLDGLVINNFQFVKKLGSGTYGLIYLVKDLDTNRVYAAKIILKDQMNLNQKDIESYKKYIQERIFFEFINNYSNLQLEDLDLDLIKENGNQISYLKEISIHLKCHHHPNVVTIHKVISFSIGLVTVMDYYEQGDLFKNIVDNRIFSPSNPLMMKNCVLQIINVINYLSSKNIYHCDLKPENILVKYNPDYRRPDDAPIVDYNEISIGLIDFGLSMEDEIICCNSCRGSSFYMSPERLVNYTKNEYIKSIIDLSSYKTRPSTDSSPMLYFPTLKGDIWSIGVLLINITCARNPWPNSSIVPNNNEVFQTYAYEDTAILKKILPISTEFNVLLNKIFKLNPIERVDLQDLYNDVIVVDFFHDSMLTPPESPV
ncbi:Serine/threonine protein kinase [Yamadazyma tenuis]|uniref:Kinase-like protein n=1 Tax=Candida tenuis (strain ATCC 10573 / BCRC 21748 / CBS 615 / JCM 9827 / NBRC 10315 / NRRL Y-1498 / VKM Y-70) TaxID=590646 RepID=G3B8E3_CANTC|nr:kinase-like protein [Yamadazyma tenuis ATCC 10573]XP_006689050.1 uncharacterized protein CANTEDRAFT_115837 [Yamadazyma tenuis ATCC 10573]EGV62879.1 kinase-like protein [Yamadazyma tenuis ATCC 10573]EGV62880.1 hypothetical protein CANTEDRAFT_115837 [Yamadazyma tenuis ATCC 10573]WEJ93643.1 Serine/threonine protein kinase [Yamadazyma tenuis]